MWILHVESAKPINFKYKCSNKAAKFEWLLLKIKLC